MKRQRPSLPAAFTLIEMLVVVALMAMIAGFTVGAIGAIHAAALTNGGQLLVDQLILAKQTATARNRTVEVRFFKISDNAGPAFRAMQLWMGDETGNNLKPLGRLCVLPDGVLIDDQAANSSLLFTPDPTVEGQLLLPGYGTCDYRGFSFRANGETDLPANGGQNSYLMLRRATATANPPPNFYLISINPINGKIAPLRP